MKNNVLKMVEYLYLFLLTTLFIIYLFPGSLLGYLLYEDIGKQPDLITNPIGTSINHFIFFAILTFLATIINSKSNKVITSLKLIFLLSILLELMHLIIPNRSFEYLDLFANILGVLLIYFLCKLAKCTKFFT